FIIEIITHVNPPFNFVELKMFYILMNFYTLKYLKDYCQIRLEANGFIQYSRSIFECHCFFAESTISFALINDKSYFSLINLIVFISGVSFNISFALFFISSYSPVFFISLFFSFFKRLFSRIKLIPQLKSKSIINIELISVH